MRHLFGKISVLFCLSISVLIGCTLYAPSTSLITMQHSDWHKATPTELFTLGDFDNLNTHTLTTFAVPWKLTTAALINYRRQSTPIKINQKSVQKILEELGFIFPDQTLNTTTNNLPSDKPIGLVSGSINNKIMGVQLEIANLGCASCHSGRTYDSHGFATNKVWLGLPNTSLNIDSYVTVVYKSLDYSLEHWDETMDTMKILYPQISPREEKTMTKFVLPQLKKRIHEIKSRGGSAIPFHNGGPGITNGIAALKLQLGLLENKKSVAEYGYTAIPSLLDAHYRSAFLYDGLYSPNKFNRDHPLNRPDLTPQHIQNLGAMVAFFTVPTQGGMPKTAYQNIAKVQKAFKTVPELSAPPFPGKINTILANQGKIIYQSRCSNCHGVYQSEGNKERLMTLNNKMIPQYKMKTDPYRWQAATPELIKKIAGTPFAKIVNAQQQPGYMGKALTGIWAKAPYLHNGSVPTLWHLMHPSARPKQFMLGGHKLNYNLLGIDGVLEEGVYHYPKGYKPYSTPIVYNTHEPGRDNAGHEFPFNGMSEKELTAVLEYLKKL